MITFFQKSDRYFKKTDGDVTIELQNAINNTKTSIVLESGIYLISSSINLKSNVTLKGDGNVTIKSIRDNTEPFALINCNSIENFKIENINFENFDMNYIYNNSLENYTNSTCINISNCNDFSIKNCSFKKYARGVSYNNSNRFFIENNVFDASNSVNHEDYLSNFPTLSLWPRVGTGSIVAWFTPNIPSNNFIIKGNIINNSGLDVAIEMLNQVWNKQESVCSNNIIAGSQSGIQVYRGSLTEPSEIDTFSSGVTISNNKIQYCWEQGIYVRGVIGVLISGNSIEYCGLSGSIGNASSASIAFRVNVNSFTNIQTEQNSNDYYTICSNNTIANHGKDGQTNDAVILIEHDNVVFSNNTIVKSKEYSNQRRDKAILVANGKKIKNFQVANNQILGNFTHGIFISDILKNAKVTDYGIISNNTLMGSFNTAISIEFYSINVQVNSNKINFADTAISLRNTPFSKIYQNEISSDIALLIRSGNDIGQTSYFMTKGAANRKKIGSSLHIDHNYFNCNSLISITETSTSDAKKWSRIKSFKNNYFNNKIVSFIDLSFTTQTTFNLKSFDKYETFIINELKKFIVKTPGQHGQQFSFDANITASSKIINVNNFDGLGHGLYLSSSDFDDIIIIESIDYDNNTITIDKAAVSTKLTTFTTATPVFIRNDVFNSYASHTLADADAELKSNDLYQLNNDRTVYQKP